MSNFLESKKIRAVLWALGGLIILFVVFGLGIAVGYDRAGFAANFNENYYHIFYGAPPGGVVGFMAPPMPVAIHGVVGTIIDIGSSTISVKDQKDNEQSVEISSRTVIRSGDSDITIENVAIGDQIAVIGEPNGEGQIDARFVRVLPSPSGN